MVIDADGVLPSRSVDECTALWKDFDQDDDDFLSDAEAARLKSVLAVVDTNKDGNISKDEFLAACKKGILKDLKSSGVGSTR